MCRRFLEGFVSRVNSVRQPFFFKIYFVRIGETYALFSVVEAFEPVLDVEHDILNLINVLCQIFRATGIVGEAAA